MKISRKHLFYLVEPPTNSTEDNASNKFDAYDIIILIFIFISLVPLFFKQETPILKNIEYIVAGVFIFDYVLRWTVADLQLKKGISSFFLYPITPWAIIDLLSIIPFFGIINPVFTLLRVFRLFRIFRIFKGLRYSKNLQIIGNVLKNNKKTLLTLAAIAGIYIVLSALIVYNVEPETFDTFFDSLYWSVTALTTVGYGDIYPLTDAGRVVSMISSLVGIAIVAMPSGVITAGFMTELAKQKTKS